MEYIPLGRSGMKVSRFVLGTLTFSGTNGFEALGNVDVERSRRMVDMAQAGKVEAAGRPLPRYPFWHRAMWVMDRPTPSERVYLEGHRRTIDS